MINAREEDERRNGDLTLLHQGERLCGRGRHCGRCDEVVGCGKEAYVNGIRNYSIEVWRQEGQAKL